MTLDQIDLLGNGFHETPDAFIKSHNGETRGAKSVDAAQRKKTSHTMSHCCETRIAPYFTYYIIAPCFFFIFTFSSNVEE